MNNKYNNHHQDQNLISIMDTRHMGSEDPTSPGSQGFKDWTSKQSKETPGAGGQGQGTCDVMQCCQMREVGCSLFV